MVIHGRTSKNIADVFSWVPDDAFGEVLQTSARKFDVVLFGDHAGGPRLRLVNGEGPRSTDGGVIADGKVPDDDGLDADDRARLHEAILASCEEIRLGLGIPAAQILDELRRPGR